MKKSRNMTKLMRERREKKALIMRELDSGAVLPLGQVAELIGYTDRYARTLMEELVNEGKVISGACDQEWMKKFERPPRTKLIAHLKQQIERDPEAFARKRIEAIGDCITQVLRGEE